MEANGGTTALEPRHIYVYVHNFSCVLIQVWQTSKQRSVWSLIITLPAKKAIISWNDSVNDKTNTHLQRVIRQVTAFLRRWLSDWGFYKHPNVFVHLNFIISSHFTWLSGSVHSCQEKQFNPVKNSQTLQLSDQSANLTNKSGYLGWARICQITGFQVSDN